MDFNYSQNSSKGLSGFILLILLCSTVTTVRAQFAPDTQQAYALFQRADSLQRIALYDSSNRLFNRAIQVNKKAKAWKRVFDCLINIGLNNVRKSNIDAAKKIEIRAGKVVEKIQNNSIYLAKLFLLRGGIEVAEANYSAAITWYEKALNLIPKDPDNIKLRTTIIFYTGDVYHNQGQLDQAIDKYYIALDLYNRSPAPDDLFIGSIYNNIGIAYQGKGNNSLALDYYQKSLQIDKRELGTDHPSVAASYNNIAIIYYYDGNYSKALDYMKNAVQTMTCYLGKEHPSVASGYNNIGIVYSEMGEPEESIKYLKKSIAITKKNLGEVHPDVATGYLNLGAIHSDNKNYDSAITYSKKALSIYRQIFEGPHPDIAYVYSNLGEAYLEKKDYEKALEYLQKDLEINKKMLGEQHPYVGDTYNKMGWIYTLQDNFPTAIHYYNQAISLLAGSDTEKSGVNSLNLESVRFPVFLMETLENKGQTHKAFYLQTKEIDHLQQALNTYLKATDLIDRMQFEYKNNESKLLLGERAYDIYRSGVETAYLLFQTTGDSRYIQYALYFTEKCKARVLIGQLMKINAKSFAGIPDSLISYETRLRQKLTRLNNSLRKKTDENTHIDSTKQNSLRDSIFAAKQQLNAHVRYIEENYPRYFHLKYKRISIDPVFIQNDLLGQNQTLIEYFYGEKSFYAFVVTKKNINLHKIKIDSTLASDLRKLRSAITGGKKNFTSLSYSVYGRIFEPIAPYIQGNHLLIIPDGMLNYLPFETLLTQLPDNSNTDYRDLHYLIRNYQISYAPSVRFLKFWEKDFYTPSRENNTRFLGFAPVFSNLEQPDGSKARYRVSPLPLSQYEIEQIASLFDREKSLFKKDPSSVFIKSEASESAFKNLQLENYNIIHLATHAYVTADTISQPAIQFITRPNSREDGMLRLNEIYNLNLNAQLVVLSACETGIGEIVKGEGIISLARAFQYSGSENLLVSLWKVEDRSTSKLMLSFYKNRLNDDSLSTALRKAKLKLLKHPRYAAPRYWGPFVLIGK